MKDVPTIDHRGLAAMTSSVSGAIGSAFSGHDVVHFHAEGPSLMCWLPKRLGKRVIVTIHGLDHQRAKWGRAASAYILQGEKNAARYADEIIVLSEGVRQYFKDTYGRDTRFIPNGVDRPKTRPALKILDWKNMDISCSWDGSCQKRDCDICSRLLCRCGPIKSW